MSKRSEVTKKVEIAVLKTERKDASHDNQKQSGIIQVIETESVPRIELPAIYAVKMVI